MTGLANAPEKKLYMFMLIIPEIFWFSNQAQADIHVYGKLPFHFFQDPGKIDEIFL
jgi:hypothetical protein